MMRKIKYIYSVIYYFCSSSLMTDTLSFLLMPFPFSLKKFLQYFRAELLAMNTLGVPSLRMPFFCLHF